MTRLLLMLLKMIMGIIKMLEMIINAFKSLNSKGINNSMKHKFKELQFINKIINFNFHGCLNCWPWKINFNNKLHSIYRNHNSLNSNSLKNSTLTSPLSNMFMKTKFNLSPFIMINFNKKIKDSEIFTKTLCSKTLKIKNNLN